MPPMKKPAPALMESEAPAAAPVAPAKPVKQLSVPELAALAHLGPKLIDPEVWAQVEALRKKGSLPQSGDTVMGPKLLNG